MSLKTKKETMQIIKILEETYPDAKAELNFTNAFELLIATILSQQCTDMRVNKTTKVLFEDYNLKTPEDFLEIGEEKLKELIHPCGFYNTKTISILNTCSILKENYGSKVPGNMEDLLKLPGVGRKTANVVLSNCFGVPGIAVDTHVFRVTNRIGIADEKTPYDVEMVLRKKIEKDMWSKAHHILIFHGRRCCRARKPECEICKINDRCNYFLER